MFNIYTILSKVSCSKLLDGSTCDWSNFLIYKCQRSNVGFESIEKKLSMGEEPE